VERDIGDERAACGGSKPKPPVSMFWLGAVDPEQLNQAKEKGARLPGPHSSEFSPVPEPTITDSSKGDERSRNGSDEEVSG